MADRRTFLGALMGSAALPLFNIGCSGVSPNNTHLVSTPELRGRYLADMLQELCTDLGPRPVGSDAFNAGADIVERELRKALPDVTRDNFTITNWVASGDAVFTVGGKRLLAYPAEQSSGTPAGGVSGILRQSTVKGYTWDIVGQEDGKLNAHVIVEKSRDAFTHLVPEWKDGPSDMPVAIIGAGDRDILADAALDGTPVRYAMDIAFVPETPASTVIGTLPGEIGDEVLLIAHQDTVYLGLGANDNTASLVGIIMLAHALSGSRPKRTIRFVATAGHELGFLGARNYMERRRGEGTLGRIKCVFDFDSVTWGENILIMTQDGVVRDTFGEIAKEQAYDWKPNLIDSNGAVLDNEPFDGSGASCIYVGSGGYDHFERVHHTPYDTPGSVPPECVENAFSLFMEYFRKTEGITPDGIS